MPARKTVGLTSQFARLAPLVAVVLAFALCACKGCHCVGQEPSEDSRHLRTSGSTRDDSDSVVAACSAAIDGVLRDAAPFRGYGTHSTPREAVTSAGELDFLKAALARDATADSEVFEKAINAAGAKSLEELSDNRYAALDGHRASAGVQIRGFANKVRRSLESLIHTAHTTKSDVQRHMALAAFAAVTIIPQISESGTLHPAFVDNAAQIVEKCDSSANAAACIQAAALEMSLDEGIDAASRTGIRNLNISESYGENVAALVKIAMDDQDTNMNVDSEKFLADIVRVCRL